MTLTGYQWSRKTKTAQLARELRPKVTKALEEFKSRRCNCDASCGENRYHDRGSPGCVFAVAPPKRNKYNAKKVELDGYVFDSQKEAKYYGNLKAMVKAGLVDRFDVHPQYKLEVNGELIATYKPDFIVWYKNHAARVFDVKSPPTAKKRDFVLIKKLMKAIHGVEVEVIT